MSRPAVTVVAPAEAPLSEVDAAPLERELTLYLSFVDDVRAPVAWRDRKGLHVETARPIVWRAVEGVSVNA